TRARRWPRQIRRRRVGRTLAAWLAEDGHRSGFATAMPWRQGGAAPSVSARGVQERTRTATGATARRRRAARGPPGGCGSERLTGSGRFVVHDRVRRPERSEFARLVEEALDAIPAEFARYLDNVSVVIEEEPTPALLGELGLDPRRDTLYGVY